LKELLAQVAFPIILQLNEGMTRPPVREFIASPWRDIQQIVNHLSGHRRCLQHDESKLWVRDQGERFPQAAYTRQPSAYPVRHLVTRELLGGTSHAKTKVWPRNQNVLELIERLEAGSHVIVR
jgi:hypothetical protein